MIAAKGILGLAGAIALLLAATPAASQEAETGTVAATEAEVEEEDPIAVCLIMPDEADLFATAIQQAASQRAEALGIELRLHVGAAEAQATAIDGCVDSDVDGILVNPIDIDALAAATGRARAAQIMVMSLAPPQVPDETADATFAADDYEVGQMIGRWAAARLGDAAADARIALIDLDPTETPTDAARDNGFLRGFGIDDMDPKDIGEEEEPRIVGHDVSDGNAEGGRAAMTRLLKKDPGINVVYAFNVAAAAGAVEVLRDAGAAQQALVVSAGGLCADVEAVGYGLIDALAMPSPKSIGTAAVDAIHAWATDYVWPDFSPGLAFTNTGAILVTDMPIDGLESVASQDALRICRD